MLKAKETASTRVDDGTRTERVGVCPLCGSTQLGSILDIKERCLGTGDIFTVVQCDSCALFRTDPRPVKEEIDRYYPDDYGPYQPSAGTKTPWLRPGFKGLIRRLTLTAHYGYQLAEIEGVMGQLIRVLTSPLRGRYVSFPRLFPGGRLLEIGCATGERLALLRDLGWEVQGVEINRQACDLARSQFGLNIFCGELEELRLPDASIDAVVMSHVIEHAYDPIAILREANRVLRPGGLVLMETPNARSLERYIFGPWWFNWEIPRHLFLFESRTLELCCKMAGLQIKNVAYSSYTFDWNRSLAYWCEDRGWNGVAEWLRSRPRVLTWVFRPLGKGLGWMKATGRMTVVGVRR